MEAAPRDAMILNARLEPMRMSDRITVKHSVAHTAFIGMLFLGFTLPKNVENGSPLSRANEKSCRELVVTMLVAQNMRLKMI